MICDGVMCVGRVYRSPIIPPSFSNLRGVPRKLKGRMDREDITLIPSSQLCVRVMYFG